MLATMAIMGIKIFLTGNLTCDYAGRHSTGGDNHNFSNCMGEIKLMPGEAFDESCVRLQAMSA